LLEPLGLPAIVLKFRGLQREGRWIMQLDRLLRNLLCKNPTVPKFTVRGDMYDTILWRRSNLNFSAFAFSYSPFSRWRWSGLNRESVGGSFSYIRERPSN
jgi:hypothetical protein